MTQKAKYDMMVLTVDTLSDITRYSAILCGIASVVRENPNFNHAVIAGVAYVGVGFCSRLLKDFKEEITIAELTNKFKENSTSKLESVVES